MPYAELLTLIPSHSLEDFPVELPEDEAASLLNAWAVPWHPACLASAQALPRWHRADDPPEGSQQRLIIVPTCCESWVPAGWIDRVTQEGATVIRGVTERQAMIAEALAGLGPAAGSVDPSLAADFLALGFCQLQVELLTRKMRHFSSLDEVHLRREVVAAAEAALAGEGDTARGRLRTCFEVLTEARERFYPVDCFLIDLCLLLPRLADDHFWRRLDGGAPLNIVSTGADLTEIVGQAQPALDRVRTASETGTGRWIGGEWQEAPLPLLPLNSVLWQFSFGLAAYERLLGRPPHVWGRRRFGLFPQLPQVLKRHGYVAALHLALDDGIYPDQEHSKIRWEGADRTVLDAASRVPLAADSASSYLRFPARLAESMDEDQAAAVFFAHWPEVHAPWFEDLRRMQTYSPTLGKFVTLEDFFENTENPGRLANYLAREYQSPYLVQAVVREEQDAISRWSNHLRRRAQFDAAGLLSGLAQALRGDGVSSSGASGLEQAIEEACERPASATAELEGRVAQVLRSAAEELAGTLLAGATAGQPGFFVFNPLSFRRTLGLEFDAGQPLPAAPGPAGLIQRDPHRSVVACEVPGAGFVWLPKAPVVISGRGPSNIPMAEPDVLRNEFFEVRINVQTGGVGQIRVRGRGPNRLSQQLNYRFSQERRLTGPEGDPEEQSQYAEMRRLSSDVVSVGPVLGEIVTTGEIVDQPTGRRLAGFQQRVRVWRGRPYVEIESELDPVRMPDIDPWNNYYAARFAWSDDGAALTRSVSMGAQPIPEQRFEAPHYIEIATAEHRTTLITPGLPFHRLTGPRMIDTLLIVPGETQRKFRIVVALDQDYPLQAALDCQLPPIVVPTDRAPAATAGWFFHLNARSVQLLRMLPLTAETGTSTDGPSRPADHASHNDAEPDAVAPRGFALRLVETEGRAAHVRLRCFQTPRAARQRDFRGRTIVELHMDGDAVLMDFTPYEIVDIELRF